MQINPCKQIHSNYYNMSHTHYSEIIPGLYLGDAGFVYETPASTFNLIVNCCPEISCSYKDDACLTESILYLKFLDRKEENQRLIKLLDQTQVLNKIHTALQENKRVMVHCAMGQQRSPTIIVCYLVQYCGFNVKDAMELVQRLRYGTFCGGANFTESMKHVYTKMIR